MSTRARLQNANDSKSLWNYTLSPGWSAFDAHILRLAVMRYGCGAWRNINRHFPLKTCGQLNLQTQRLFGQQALAEFQKVHVDPNKIKVINDKIDGFRKNTCLINTGNNLTAEEKENRRQEHIKKYGIPKELYEKIKVPVVLDPPTPCKTVIDDIEKLREMYRCIYDIQLRLKHLKENKGNNAANIALRANKAKKAKKAENNNNNKNNKNTNNNKSASKPNVREDSKENMDDEDVEMVDNNKKNENSKNNKNKNVEDGGKKGGDNDNNSNECVMMEEPMDDDVAMAMALSASMQQANIDTPKSAKKTKKQKSKKKSTSKKKNSTSSKKKRGKKRKKMDSDGDESYVPPPAKKRVKTK